MPTKEDVIPLSKRLLVFKKGEKESYVQIFIKQDYEYEINECAIFELEVLRDVVNLKYHLDTS